MKKQFTINEEYGNTAKYFSNLGSKNRLGILLCLQNQDRRLSEISKEIGSTAQEVYRNISQLMEQNMIVKTNTNAYRISDVGRILTSMISIPMFIEKHNSFFHDHPFDELPPKFIKRIGDLEDCELISNVTLVLEKIAKIYENSEQFVDDAVSESFDSFDEILLKKISKQIPYRHMINKDHKEQNKRQYNLEKNGYYEGISNGTIKRRLLSQLNFALIINEKEAAVIFPGHDKNPDYRKMFYGSDKQFHDWCTDLYDYFWQRGKDYTRKPIKLQKRISN